MRKVCTTCYLGQLKECPSMNTPPKYFCFAWCKDKAEWQKRQADCKRYYEKSLGTKRGDL